MMRGPGVIATAVRRPTGEVEIQRQPFTGLASRNRFFALPLVRGTVGLFEMMMVGMRALNYSAIIAVGDRPTLPLEGSKPETSRKEMIQTGFTVAFSLLLAIAVFMVTPLVLTGTLFTLENNPMAFNLVAGIVRLGLFLGYLAAIAQLADVKRLFMYHGAEHKTVSAYEQERVLTVDAARRHSRFHPRCGTSFLLVVMIAAILVYSLLDTVLLQILGRLWLPERIGFHLLALPLVAGASYEVIRGAARHAGTRLGRMVIAPGLWLQRITTREPDDRQLAVAVAALHAALTAEGTHEVQTGK